MLKTILKIFSKIFIESPKTLYKINGEKYGNNQETKRDRFIFLL